MPFARAVGAAGACLAVEPIPFLADAVRRTAFANGLDWIEVFQCAASADAAAANLELRYGGGGLPDSGGSRLVEPAAARAETVALLQGHGYEPVGVLFRHAVLPVTWHVLLETGFPLDEKGAFDILFRARGP